MTETSGVLLAFSSCSLASHYHLQVDCKQPLHERSVPIPQVPVPVLLVTLRPTTISTITPFLGLARPGAVPSFGPAVSLMLANLNLQKKGTLDTCRWEWRARRTQATRWLIRG